ncbi:hypothetical protein [Streptomyces swartbergensis]|uniref:hypothetical protein n=1 Tax=Streptomyces swartbergensis TaxID=487165 RepID=UPI0037F67BDE
MPEDASCAKRCTERKPTAYEHAWEIRDATHPPPPRPGAAGQWLGRVSWEDAMVPYAVWRGR